LGERDGIKYQRDCPQGTADDTEQRKPAKFAPRRRLLAEQGLNHRAVAWAADAVQ
jgi:hypothetical protein